MGNRISFDEISKQLRSIYGVMLCYIQDGIQNDAPYLVRYGQLRVSLVTSAKRPPIVSYASNLFTVHKMLYCIIVKVKLAIWAAKCTDWHLPKFNKVLQSLYATSVAQRLAYIRYASRKLRERLVVNKPFQLPLRPRLQKNKRTGTPSN